MKGFSFGIFASIVMVTFAVTIADAEGPNAASRGLDVSAIAGGLGNKAFWQTLLLALVSGAVGGLVYELLILQGRIEWPHKAIAEEEPEQPTYAISRFMYDLAVFARLIIGAMAAIAAMLVLSPSTTFTMIATALVAGSAGTSIFKSIQDRLLAALAQKDAADARRLANAQANKVGEIGTQLADLKVKLANAQADKSDLDELDRIDRILTEVKGISGVIAKEK